MLKRNIRGFTLIELVVVTAVMVLLTGLILVNYRSGQRQQALARSVHKLARDLRRAQEMAASSKEFEDKALPGGYGIYFTGSEPKHYVLFANQENNQKYDPLKDPIIEDIALEPGAEITSLFPSPLTIIFIPPTPEIIIDPDAASAFITLNVRETVRVRKSGLIEIE